MEMIVEGCHQSFDDFDLENDTHFQSRLRYFGGLFLSVYQGWVYFLHQTAREFLLGDFTSSTTIALEPRWHHSTTLQAAHTVIVEINVPYPNFVDLSFSTPDTEEEMDALLGIYPFSSC
ncbi:unnamed protein product [Clonostachys solani]|uniref:Uncharacterized protein n=1 Tax=Clonostachys solani TaxID=160281 RepID=A0A9N9W9D2_9HYPO|nr:unnamed protein product [Clonostachys solani]